jgi:hypothetical protein
VPPQYFGLNYTFFKSQFRDFYHLRFLFLFLLNVVHLFQQAQFFKPQPNFFFRKPHQNSYLFKVFSLRKIGFYAVVFDSFYGFKRRMFCQKGFGFIYFFLKKGHSIILGKAFIDSAMGYSLFCISHFFHNFLYSFD